MMLPVRCWAAAVAMPLAGAGAQDWDGRGACGASDEAHVDGGQLPAAGVAGQDQGGASGFGDRVALVAAAGVVARGHYHGVLADRAVFDLIEAEVGVAEVA